MKCPLCLQNVEESDFDFDEDTEAFNKIKTRIKTHKIVQLKQYKS